MEKIILGIDPGTTLMGYGVLRVADRKAEMLALGVIDLRKYADHYLKLGRIFERVSGIIDSYLPDELAIEAPFFGKNVQSMLKLGRAQGVAMAAAIHRQVPITEYAPMKIKMAITGKQGAGGLHAAADAPPKARGDGTLPGRHRCAGRGLLPLPADGTTDDRQEVQQLEGLRAQEPYY